MYKRSKSFCIVFLAMLLITMLSVAMVANLKINAEEDKDVSENFLTSIEEKCIKLTNNEIDWKNFDKSHVEKYVPIELFQQVGSYGYIGKQYGFVVVVEPPKDELINYYISVIFLEVDYKNIENLSSIEYKINPTLYLSYGFSKLPTDSVSLISNIASDLVLGDIVLMPELNTVNQLDSSDENYDIENDLSTYIDYATIDYAMEEKSVKDSLMSYASILTTALGPIVDNTLFAGFPASSILSVLLAIPDKTVVNKGVNVNSLSYTEQVKNNRLETACALYMGEGRYLAPNQDNELTLTIKYDNKVHSQEDFQLGLKIGFNIYHFSPITSITRKLNEEMFSCNSVFDSFEDGARQYKLKSREIYLEGDREGNRIIDKFHTNKFFNNGNPLQLNFFSNETRWYDLKASDNTEVSPSSIDAERFNTYSVNFDMKNTLFAKVQVQSDYELSLGKSKIHEGFSVYEFTCEETDAYMFSLRSEQAIRYVIITDEQGWIVNKAYGNSRVTGILQKGHKYKLYVESPLPQNVVLEQKISNDKVHNNVSLWEGEEYYISWVSQFNNYVYLKNCELNYDIYDSKGELYNGKYLVKGNKYYFRVYHGIIRGVSFEVCYTTLQGVINNQIDLVPSMNQIIEFDCKKTFNYDFGDKFDVYCDNELTENVNCLFMEEGKKYYIINNYAVQEICIKYKVLPYNFYYDELECLTIYELTLNDYMVLTSAHSNQIKVYDIAQVEREYHNGFLLSAGKYYLIANQDIDNDLQETKKEFNVQLKLSEEETKNMPVFYGYPFSLDVVSKEGYRFMGWFYNGKKITNELGESLGVYVYYDNIQLEAEWLLLNIYIQIQSDGSILWVTNEGQLTENQAEANINMNILNKLVDDILQLKYTKSLIKEGHYKSKIVRLENNQNNEKCIIQLKIEWEKEKYNLVFEELLEQNILAEYGAKINIHDSIFEIQNNNCYVFEYWYFEQNGIEYELSFKYGEPFVVFDLTDGFENDHAETILIRLKRHLVEKNVEFIISIHMPNSPDKNPTRNVEPFAKNCYLLTEYNLNELLLPNINLNHYELYTFDCEQIAFDRDNKIFKIVYNFDPIVRIKVVGKDYSVGFSSLYGDSVNNHQTSYNTADPKIQLPDVYRLRWNHVGWTIFGKKYGINDIAILEEENFGNLFLYGDFSYEEVDVSNGAREYYTNSNRNKYRAVRYNLTNVSSDIIIKVSSYVQYIEFRSSGQIINNIYVEVSTYVATDIELSHCNFVGREAVKNASEPEKLGYVFNASSGIINNLDIYGKIIIRQADFKVENNNYLIGAVMTGPLTLNAKDKNSGFTVHSGNGVGHEGKNGISAGSAWLASPAGATNAVITLNSNVYVHCGNATDGIDGVDGGLNENGTRGGDAGSVGYCFMTNGILTISSEYIIIAAAGHPGRGGNGGNGGNGQNAEWFGQSSMPGGNGGNGGNGGKTFKPIQALKINGSNWNPAAYPGLGGNGGIGGIGGKPLVGEKRPNGQNGTPGKSYSVK